MFPFKIDSISLFCVTQLILKCITSSPGITGSADDLVPTNDSAKVFDGALGPGGIIVAVVGTAEKRANAVPARMEH